jgi:hypothetical protein
MALAIILLITLVLTVVPIVGYQRWERRRALRAPEEVSLGPVRGPDFWRVEGLIAHGTRAPDAHARAQVRAEIAWRRACAPRLQRVIRPLPWWMWTFVACVWIGGVLLTGMTSHDWGNAALNLVIGPAMLVLSRHNMRSERARLDKALAANAD